MTDFETLARHVVTISEAAVYPDIPGLSVASSPTRRGWAMPDSRALTELLYRTLTREAADYDALNNIHRLNVNQQPAFFGRLAEAIAAVAAETGFATTEQRPLARGSHATVTGIIDYARYGITERLVPGDTVRLTDRSDDPAWPDTEMWEVLVTSGAAADEYWLIPANYLQVTS